MNVLWASVLVLPQLTAASGGWQRTRAGHQSPTLRPLHLPISSLTSPLQLFCRVRRLWLATWYCPQPTTLLFREWMNEWGRSLSKRQSIVLFLWVSWGIVLTRESSDGSKTRLIAWISVVFPTSPCPKTTSLSAFHFSPWVLSSLRNDCSSSPVWSNVKACGTLLQGVAVECMS